MQKYRPIYIVAFFCLLGFAAKAQPDTTSTPISLKGTSMLSLGMEGGLGDFFSSSIETNKPRYSGFDLGINTFIQDNIYVGLTTGTTSGAFENVVDTTYSSISSMPLGFNLGIWSSFKQIGIEFSSGFLFPQKAKMQVRSGSYFSADLLFFLAKGGSVVASAGYKSTNYVLADYTYTSRAIGTFGLRFYLY